LSVTNKVQELTRRKVVPLLAIDREIKAKLKMGTDTEEVPVAEGFGDVVDALDMEFDIDEEQLEEGDAEESAPIIQLANRIIEDAYYSGGSDIHVEPFEKDCRVRVRVDGVLQEKLNLPTKVAGALLARFKIMSNLDIAEKRMPQDGRIVFKQFTRKPINIDLRVSTAPLNHGEGVVMRILDKSKSTLPLPALGFEPENLERYRECITRPYGMILHCGPTGSGKSMTLYSALNEINDPGICIRTAEDPIEYTLPGLCQMQMHRKIGLTFAAALRAILRQDPDIILVGEIRDSETANIAVEAALTGHMLFSTLHTNDAPGTVARLTEMGVESFMVSASIVAVCAQRLMRRVCKSCRQAYEPEAREFEILRKSINFEGGTIFRANRTGCPRQRVPASARGLVAGRAVLGRILDRQRCISHRDGSGLPSRRGGDQVRRISKDGHKANRLDGDGGRERRRVVNPPESPADDWLHFGRSPSCPRLRPFVAQRSADRRRDRDGARHD